MREPHGIRDELVRAQSGSFCHILCQLDGTIWRELLCVASLPLPRFEWYEVLTVRELHTLIDGTRT